jgi:alkylation response protein AidB-like acyl-CoA dehydrogenase
LKRHKGINAFIVEKGWAGFDIGPKEKKMGIRGLIHTSLFNDVKVQKKIDRSRWVGSILP